MTKKVIQSTREQGQQALSLIEGATSGQLKAPAGAKGASLNIKA